MKPRLFRNRSWCDGCEADVQPPGTPTVRVGSPEDYESATAYLCFRCLQAALEVMTCPACNAGVPCPHSALQPGDVVRIVRGIDGPQPPEGPLASILSPTVRTGRIVEDTGEKTIVPPHARMLRVFVVEKNRTRIIREDYLERIE